MERVVSPKRSSEFNPAQTIVELDEPESPASSIPVNIKSQLLKD